MKRKLIFAVAMLFTISLCAQDIEKKQELKGEISSSLSALRLATDLVKYGYSQQTALPLIDALQIINDNPTQPLKAEREGDKVDTSKKDGKTGEMTLDYEKILADAKEFAAGNDYLLKLISQIETEKGNHRGAVNGPSRVYETVNGHSTDTYRINFVANYLAEVVVSGDGDTDLDLYVYDSNGNLIAKDEDYTDGCYVRWCPAWTGRFIIKIVNRGPVYNRYVLLTN